MGKFRMSWMLMITIGVFFSSFYNKDMGRNILISAMVFDVETRKPLEGASIISEGGTLIGTTNAQGILKVNYEYMKAGEILLRLRVGKDGYDTLIQQERWADLSERIFLRNKASRF